MHKKPIYGGRIYSDRSNSDITFRDFLKKIIQHHWGFSGAAQNMDLFMHTHPLLIEFVASGRLMLLVALQSGRDIEKKSCNDDMIPFRVVYKVFPQSVIPVVC